jgi:chromosome segregation ATPase
MNLIEQHMENVSRELAQLEEQLARLKAEQDETRKLLNNIRRYRKSLVKQYPSSQATLPLAPPDDEEEEATDEAPEAESPAETEPLVPGEWSPGYEVPEEDAAIDDSPMSPSEEEQYAQDLAVAEEAAKPWKPADTVEPEKPIRRRKSKAAAEERHR